MNATAQVSGAVATPTPHVLLVEDELSVAKGLEMSLTEEGYGVDLAMTGNNALEKFRDSGFDLVVTDLRLPDIDGLEIVKTIKTERPESKVIIITGYPSVSSAVSAVRMGVQDYLRKPFTEEEFLTAVSGALQHAQDPSMEQLLVAAEEQTLIQRREVIRALEMAARVDSFALQLLEDGSRALSGFDLSVEAKAAILTGDLNWLRNHVGDLNDEQQEWVFRRLSVERPSPE